MALHHDMAQSIENCGQNRALTPLEPHKLGEGFERIAYLARYGTIARYPIMLYDVVHNTLGNSKCLGLHVHPHVCKNYDKTLVLGPFVLSE